MHFSTFQTQSILPVAVAFEGATGSWLDSGIEPKVSTDLQVRTLCVSCAWVCFSSEVPSHSGETRCYCGSVPSSQANEAGVCARVHSGAVQEAPGAEMRTEMSPRALVFSSDRPERNAVSIATCRHSVMTWECMCVCVCTSV